MTRRLRTDRMRERARETRTVQLLRASGEEIRCKVESGDWTINRARAELGLPPLAELADMTATGRPGDLAKALTRTDLPPLSSLDVAFPIAWDSEEIAKWRRAWDEQAAVGGRQGCKPECPTGFHYHTAVGVTSESTVAAYERGDWTPSFVDPHANPSLIGTTNEPWPPRGWLKRIIRRITRRNGAPTE